jgi:hypothetical protein
MTNLQFGYFMDKSKSAYVLISFRPTCKTHPIQDEMDFGEGNLVFCLGLINHSIFGMNFHHQRQLEKSTGAIMPISNPNR